MNILPPFLINLRHKLQDKPDADLATTIIDEYFFCYDLADLEEELGTLTDAALANADFRKTLKTDQADDVLFFFEYTLLFVQAAHYLYQKSVSSKKDK